MRFYKLAFAYSAFNTGYSITAPIKWAAALFGITSVIDGSSPKLIIIGAVAYFLLCIAIGVPAFKFGWIDAIHEVQNRYNPFVKELRNSKIFKPKN